MNRGASTKIRLRVNLALLWKEWREQRWRFVLSLLVLVVLSASLVRAQLVALPEAVLIVFGLVGLLLAIFLALGGIATEREDNTWPFLRARPVRAAELLQVKWFFGAASLVTSFVAAGLAAHAAAASRNLFDLPPPPARGSDGAARDPGPVSPVGNRTPGPGAPCNDYAPPVRKNRQPRCTKTSSGRSTCSSRGPRLGCGSSLVSRSRLCWRGTRCCFSC